MKQPLNTRRKLAINWRYCYSARRAMQNMSASRSLPTIALSVYSGGFASRLCPGPRVHLIRPWLYCSGVVMLTVARGRP